VFTPRPPPPEFHVRPDDPLADLARGAAARQPRATEAFVTTTGLSVVRVVRRILGAHCSEVDDTVQEATFAVLEALPGFRGECSVLHFVCRVATLTAMNARRRAQIRAHVTVPTDDVESHASEAPSPMSNVAASRRREACRVLLDELPPAQAEVLALHCALGYTIEEIASATGSPANTVRGRLVTAKTALRERLAADEELTETMRGVS
jgi:RNA polymerase sigma-70 factor (ECF subfamily)